MSVAENTVSTPDESDGDEALRTRAAAVRGKIATGLPTAGSRWRHATDATVRLEVTAYAGCKVTFRRVLADGTRGLEQEAGLRRFLATFVPEETR